MSFFGKLKDRLFKSSSKLDEGLEAIVEDGGEIAAPDPDVTPGPETPPEPAPEIQPELDPTPDPEPETVPDPEPETVPEPEPETVPEPEPETEPVPRPDPVPHPRPDVTPPPAPTEVPQPDRPAGVPGPAGTPQEMPGTTAPVEMPMPETPAEVPTRTPGLIGRLLGRGGQQEVLRRTLDDDMLEQLEELLAGVIPPLAHAIVVRPTPLHLPTLHVTGGGVAVVLEHLDACGGRAKIKAPGDHVVLSILPGLEQTRPERAR